jgi:hypothetical protein
MPITKNLFHEGLILGLDPSIQKNTTLVGGSDVRLVGKDNSSFVATNLKGMDVSGQLPTGFVCIAKKTFNGIAYFLSAQVVNDAPTGIGEIGCFPSPDYSSGIEGSLVNAYSPLRNYGGDNGTYLQKNGPFRSTEFKFDLQNIHSLEIQPDYDGSVNLVFTDGKNPMRIINSGFSVLPGNRFEIINREGTKDTNRYSKGNFNNIINLISKSDKIMKIAFEGVEPGGSLKGGNYHYYFKYATMDGNETDVVGQSFTVSVFHGNTVATIRGSRGEGENTDKRVKFTLSNLDESYKYVRGYFVFAAGDVEEVKSAFRINENYHVRGNSLEFIHNGLEGLERIDIADLSVDYSPVDNSKSFAQVGGYLVAANIKEKSFNREPLEKFARKIKLGLGDQLLDIIGVDNLERVYNENMSNAIFPFTNGANGAYYNPYNIYHRLGYHGGETYPFAVAFIFPDGGLSKAFPCMGFDPVSNNNALSGIGDNEIDSMVNNDGFMSNTLGLVNIKGLYRFPNRNTGKFQMLMDGRVSINGVTFEIPSLTSEEYINIKKETIGIVFLRGERKADKITQGYIINTMPVPNIKFTHVSNRLSKYMDNEGGYTDSNSMFIPVFNYSLESTRYHESLNNGERRILSGSEGIWPTRFNLKNRELHKDKKFAFISNDVILNKQKYLQSLNGRDISIMVLRTVSFQTKVPTLSLGSKTVPHYYSLIQTKYLTHSQYLPVKRSGKASWVEGGNSLKNNDNFSGGAWFQAYLNDTNYGIYPIYYNDYVGLTLDAPIPIATPSTADAKYVFTDGEPVNTSQINQIVHGSQLVNIYGPNGQRTPDMIKSVYGNIDGNRYTPISARMTWDELESSLMNRKIICFNGDCFVGLGHRRVFYNQVKKAASTAEEERSDNANIGYTISLVTESDHNVALRSTEIFDINEDKDRSFAPYCTKKDDVKNEYGEDNSWRVLRAPESNSYNKGYGKVFADKEHITLPQGVPYLGSKYFTRLMWAGPHIPNSFENSYRIWTGMNFQDYPTQYGEIVDIKNLNGMLLVVFEHGVGLLGINERVQTGHDNGGSIFLESSGVLTPHIRMVDEQYGSKFKNSIEVSDNTGYGVDGDNTLIWQVHVDDSPMNDQISLKDIGKLTIEPYLTKHAKHYKNKKSHILTHDIVSSWDSNNKEILFTFYNKSLGAKENFTFSYIEGLKLFNPQFSALPYAAFNLNGSFYMFNSEASNNVFWKCDSEIAMAQRQKVFGQSKPFRLRFIVNADYEVSKIFDNLQIVGNNILPDKIRYYVQGAYTEQQIVYDNKKIYLSNAKYRDEKVEVVIPSVKSITDQDPTGYFLPDMDNAESILQAGSRFKGKFMVIELEYNTNKRVNISSVLTLFRHQK